MLKEILEFVETDEGITYDYKEECRVRKGYAVAINKEFEEEVYPLTEKELIRYIHLHYSLLTCGNYCLGVWKFANRYWLDVVRIETDPEIAKLYAKEHNQVAIYDLDNNMELYI